MSEKLPDEKKRRSSSAAAAARVTDEGTEAVGAGVALSRTRLKPAKPEKKAVVEAPTTEPAASSGPTGGAERKFVLRPSVLGDVTSGPPVKEGSFSAGATSDLIVEGKRQWKPTQKMRQVSND